MSDNTAIVKTGNSTLVANVSDLRTIAEVFIKSGFFQDTRDIAQAQVKIMAGREIGLEPFASMSGIHVIKGKVTYGANVMAAKVKGSGRYDYRVREMSDKACRIMFYQLVNGKWEEIGPSDFTIEDARKAGTQNLDKFPRNMLFARAISNGVRWYCPDVTSGVTMYAPEELGAVVDDGGQVVAIDGVETSTEEVTTDAPAQSLSGFKAAPKTESEPMSYELAAARLTPKGARYDSLTLEQLETIIASSPLADSRTAAGIVHSVKAAAISESDSDGDMLNDSADGLPFGDK